MDNTPLLKVLVLFVILQTTKCQNLAGLIATLSGNGMNGGFPFNMGNTDVGTGGGGGGGGGGSSGCPYQPHPITNKFIQMDNSRRTVQTCAPGTEYDHSKCACVTKRPDSGPPKKGSNPRLQAMSNKMNGMQMSPPGMSKMMAEFLRRMQNQQGNVRSPIYPTTPVKPPTPTALPAPIKPKSRSNHNQMEQMRQMMQKMPGDRPTLAAPLPFNIPYKPMTQNDPKTRPTQEKKRIATKPKRPTGQKSAHLEIGASRIKPGPAYNPKPAPASMPLYSPIKNTNGLPPSILKILGEVNKPSTTTPLPISNGSKKPRPATNRSEAINTIFRFLSGAQQTKPKSPPSIKTPPKSGRKQVPKKNDLNTASNGPKKTKPKPYQQNNGLKNNNLLAMLNSTNQLKANPNYAKRLQAAAGNDFLSLLSGGSKLTNPYPTQSTMSAAGNDLFAMLNGAKKTNLKPVGPRPSQNDILAMLTGAKQAKSKLVKPTAGPSQQAILAMLAGAKPIGSNNAGSGSAGAGNDPYADLFGFNQRGSGRKLGGQASTQALNAMFGGGTNNGNPFGGMGAFGGLGGNMGGMGGGNGGADMASLLAALGGGAGGGGGLGNFGNLGAMSALTGTSQAGAPPIDMTNHFNAQGQLMPPSGLAGLNNVNHMLMTQLDRQGIIDVGDLTPAGLIAANNHFTRRGARLG